MISSDYYLKPSIHEKTKYFPFLPDTKTIKVEDFSIHMMKNKPGKNINLLKN